MRDKIKKKNENEFSVIFTALKCFLLEIDGAVFVFFIVISSIFLSKFLEFKVEKINTKINKDESINRLKRIIVHLCLLELSSYFFIAIKRYLFTKYMANYRKKMSLKAFKSIIRHNSVGIDVKNGTTQYYLSEGSKAISKLTSTLILDIFPQIVGISVSCYELKKNFGPEYAVIIFLLIFSSMVLDVFFTIIELKYRKLKNKTRGKFDKTLYEAFSNKELIQSFNTSAHEEQKYKQKLEEYLVLDVKHDRIGTITKICRKVMFSILKNLIYLYYLIYVIDVDMAGETLRHLSTYVKFAEKSSSSSGDIYKQIRDTVLNGRMVLDFIVDLKEIEKHNAIQKFESSIEFRDVYFSFQNKLILADANFKILKNEKIAIVGENGTGKSTMLKILLGLYEFEGSILIDGICSQNLNYDNIRNLFSYAPQSPYLFDDTIEYNLKYGNQTICNSKIIEVCKILGIHDSIMKLKLKYNTIIGEGGRLMSGGERQKISIARALLRDTNVLLLDEPSSNLDNFSQIELMKIILNFCSEKTVIVIIHDIELIENFDKIIYVADNTVKAFGNHKQLIEENNIAYCKFYNKHTGV